MSVDAISGGDPDDPDTSRPVTGAADFSVDIVVRSPVGTGYNGYLDGLAFDSSVVNVTAVTQFKIAGFSACGGVDFNNSDNSIPGYTGTAYDNGCTNFGTPWTFTGVVTTVTMHCVGNGTDSPLHLITPAEDAFGTTTQDINAANINTGLTDALVTCSGFSAPPAGAPEAAGVVRWVAQLWDTLENVAAKP